MNDKVIITYIKLKKEKYTSQYNSPSKKKEKKEEKNLITLTLTTLQK